MSIPIKSLQNGGQHARIVSGRIFGCILHTFLIATATCDYAMMDLLDGETVYNNEVQNGVEMCVETTCEVGA